MSLIDLSRRPFQIIEVEKVFVFNYTEQDVDSVKYEVYFFMHYMKHTLLK